MSSPFLKGITVLVELVGLAAGLIVAAQAYGPMRRSKGNTRRLLRIIVLLGLYLIVSRLFWQGLVLVPEAYIDEGTPAYPYVIGIFWGLDLAIALIALRIWIDMRRVNG